MSSNNLDYSAQGTLARAGSAPVAEKMRRNCRDVARAQKDSPAATAEASSPTGRPTVQSLLGAQLSKGLYMTMDGASALDVLAKNAPWSSQQCIVNAVSSP